MVRCAARGFVTALTRAIVNHDLETIEALLASSPELADITETGWLPIVWARKTGNYVVLMRYVRLSGVEQGVDFRAELRKLVAAHSSHEYSSGLTRSAVERIWAQAMEDQPPHPFDRSLADVQLDARTRLDVRHFLRRAGITSARALGALAMVGDDDSGPL
jgi:hypothetical protein